VDAFVSYGWFHIGSEMRIGEQTNLLNSCPIENRIE